MKLIDMEKALSELCLSHKDIIYIDKNETAERIRKIPSIDIVRCRECKYFIDTKFATLCLLYFSYGHHIITVTCNAVNILLYTASAKLADLFQIT